MRTRITSYPTRIPEIYGSFIAIGLIAYFLISYWAGFVHVIVLRLLNFPILLAGVYFALQQYKRTHGDQIGYFRAFTIGVAASSIGVLTFVLFLFIAFLLDPKLFIQVVKGEPLGEYLNIFMATSAVTLEGIFSGVMATYIITNYIDTQPN